MTETAGNDAESPATDAGILAGRALARMLCDLVRAVPINTAQPTGLKLEQPAHHRAGD